MDPSAALATEVAGSGQPPKALSVGEVVARIRGAVEGAFPATLWVEGELSNCSYAASGHIYFTLVDPQATDRAGQRLILPCAFFRSANQSLKFRLEDGDQVVCLAQVTTYEARGQYQLRVLRVLRKGEGELQRAFEQLKKRLEAEGLFDAARKRPIPTLPDRIGLVTSPAGSVVHDMVARLRGHFNVVILPVRVQGDGAAAEIVQAIALANRRRLADLLIVARGGGSLEELWAFNEESVARAIAGSQLPVISAIGHEDHWTIADYVADRRASTPTHAAQQLAQERQLLVQQVNETVERLLDGMTAALDAEAQRVDELGERLRLLHPLLQVDRGLARVRELHERMVRGARFAMERAERTLQGLAGRLEALSPLAVLGRGYSITLRLPGRTVLTAAGALQAGDELETWLARGRVRSRVSDVEPDRAGVDGAGA
jgi:exodeoxyribonuclease VII large subunit